jgi:hypothetical protein
MSASITPKLPRKMHPLSSQIPMEILGYTKSTPILR